MRRFVQHITLGIILLLSSLVSFAQVTPVQVSPQLVPPYSLQVSEYYSGTIPKIQVLLINRDINQPTIQVKLKMTVESQNCRLRTKEVNTIPTITLTNGVPYYLAPSELQALFSSANLDFGGGLSEQQYNQTGRLPEGLYTFTFEAYELYSGNLVSNKGFSMGWLTLADPPLLNTPSKGEEVTPNSTQSIVFNWTPRHNTSPTAAYMTEYLFTLVEYNDAALSPEAAFVSSNPILQKTVTTTTMLFSNQEAITTNLVEGKRYAWRVQAKAKNGAVEIPMFRNNGISEVHWFVYKNSCTAPQGITVNVQGQRATIEWQNNPLHLEWKVEYREQNNPKAEWFTLSNTLPRVVIMDLKPSTNYEYRVGGACYVNQFTYSPLAFFSTANAPVPPVVNCGDSSYPVLGTAGLQTLNAGDTIRAGSFTVKVGYSTGSGSFTGTGYVIVPWLMNAKVEVKFTNITMSTDYKLVSGLIETTYDPTESGIDDIDEYVDIFKAGYGVGDVVTGEVTADKTVDFIVQWPNGINVTLPPNYNNQTGQGSGPITIVLTPQGGGAATTYTVDQLPTTIKDKDGNLYQVDKAGNISQIGKAGGGELLKQLNTKVIDKDKAEVKFVDYPTKQVYAFDEWKEVYKKSSTFNKEYERIGDYYVSQKAIAPGQTDYLKAVVTVTDTSVNPRNIEFVNGKGTIYSKKALDSTYKVYEISIVGGPEKDAQEIYAVYKPSSTKTLNLGKVKVSSYPKREYKVKLVPVNGTVVSTTQIRDSLNSIYNRINIFFNVTEEQSFNNTLWDNGDGKLDVSSSSLLSKYSPEMNSLVNEFRLNRLIEKDALYLFVLNEAKSDQPGVQAGDMPRGKQFGFLFVQNHTSPIYVVAGHEVGHGLFSLKHLEEHGFAPNEVGENLMQYNNKNFLSKAQWDLIYDPPVMAGLFDSNNDDAFVSYSGFALDSSYYNADNKTITFLTPGGTYINLPSTVKETFYLGKVQWSRQFELFYPYIPGALQSFVIDKKTYSACYQVDAQNNKRSFLGYKVIPEGESKLLLKDDYNTESLSAEYIKTVPLQYLVMGVYTDRGFEVAKFNASGVQLSQYTNTIVDIPNDQELYSKLKPYSGTFTVAQHNGRAVSYVTRYYNDEKAFGKNGQFIKSFIAAHSGKQTVILATKMAMWSLQYNETYNAFTDYSERWGWDGQFLSYGLQVGASLIGFNPSASIKPFDQLIFNNTDGIRDKWESADKGDFYINFLLKLRNFNVQKHIEIMQVIDNLTATSNRDQVISALKLMNEKKYVDLKMEKRILLLDILSSSSMPDDVEILAINLLKYVSDEDLLLGGADIALDYIKTKSKVSGNEIILKNLIYHIDDSVMGYGGNNYRELMLQFYKYCMYSEKFRDAASGITVDNVRDYTIEYNYEDFYSRLWKSLASSVTHGIWAPTGNQTKVTLNDDLTVSIEQTLKQGFVQIAQTTPKVFQPFAPVVLINKSDLGMANGIGYSDSDYELELKKFKAEGNKDQGRQIPFIVVPALLTYYIDDKADNELTMDCITTIADVATIATGVGPALRAVSTFRKAMAIMDVTGASISLTGNIVADITNSQDIKDFSNASSMVFGFFGLANMNATKSTKIDDIVKTLSDQHQILEWQKVENFASSISNINNGDKVAAVTTLNTNISARYARMTEQVVDRLMLEAKAAGQNEVLTKLIKAKEIIKDVKGLGTANVIANKIRYGSEWLKSSVQSTWKKLFEGFKTLEDESRIIVKELSNGKKEVIYLMPGNSTEFKLGEIASDGNSFEKNTNIPAELNNSTKENIIEVLDEGRYSVNCKNGACALVEGGCVISTTLIHTADGTVTADKIKKGMFVKAWDETKKDTVLAKVEQVFTRGVARLIEIFNWSTEKFCLTPNHPVYVPALKNYLRADSIRKGMVVLTMSGAMLTVDSVAAKDTFATVYNYDIETHHNYFIGDAGILVHNGGGCFVKEWPAITNMPDEFFNYFVSRGKYNLLNAFENLYGTNSVLLNKFISGEYSYKAWEVLFESGTSVAGSHLKDPSTLLAVSNIYKNELSIFANIPSSNPFFGAVISNEERFRKMMNSLERNFPCETCGPNGVSNITSHQMPSLQEIWNTVKFAINDQAKYGSYLNGGRIFAEGRFTTRYGYLWELTSGKKLVEEGKTIVGSTKALGNGTFSDWLTSAGFFECKSMSKEAMKAIGDGTWSDYQQFLGYISDNVNTTNWSKVNYRFSPWNFAGDVEAMKSELRTQFQKLYKSGKGEEIFNAMWNNVGVRDGLWGTVQGATPEIRMANAKLVFYSLADDTNSVLYQFIN